MEVQRVQVKVGAPAYNSKSALHLRRLFSVKNQDSYLNHVSLWQVVFFFVVSSHDGSPRQPNAVYVLLGTLATGSFPWHVRPRYPHDERFVVVPQ